MSLNGGYKIIDFKGTNFDITSSSTWYHKTVDGIYQDIISAQESKGLCITNLSIGGTVMQPFFVATAIPSDNGDVLLGWVSGNTRSSSTYVFQMDIKNNDAVYICNMQLSPTAQTYSYTVNQSAFTFSGTAVALPDTVGNSVTTTGTITQGTNNQGTLLRSGSNYPSLNTDTSGAYRFDYNDISYTLIRYQTRANNTYILFGDTDGSLYYLFRNSNGNITITKLV